MYKPHLFRILLGAPKDGMLAFALRREIHAVRSIGDGEWSDLLTDCESRGLIECADDAVFGDRRVKLTAAGRRAAASR